MTRIFSMGNKSLRDKLPIRRIYDVKVLPSSSFSFANFPAGPPAVNNTANRVTNAPNKTYPKITCTIKSVWPTRLSGLAAISPKPNVVIVTTEK